MCNYGQKEMGVIVDNSRLMSLSFCRGWRVPCRGYFFFFFNFFFYKENCSLIDPFKVNAAILPGVQNYWGERAVKHKLQMATQLNNLFLCQNTLVVR